MFLWLLAQPPIHSTNLDGVHLGVALLVVGRVDEDLVKDLVEAGHEGDLAVHDLARLGVEHPHFFGGRHDRSDVGVGPEEENDELKQSFTFISLNFAPWHGGGSWIEMERI